MLDIEKRVEQNQYFIRPYIVPPYYEVLKRRVLRGHNFANASIKFYVVKVCSSKEEAKRYIKTLKDRKKLKFFIKPAVYYV